MSRPTTELHTPTFAKQCTAQLGALNAAPLTAPRASQRLCKRLLETQGGLVVTTADDGDVALQQLIDSYAPGGTLVDFVLMDLQARPSLLVCWRLWHIRRCSIMLT